MVYLWGGGGVVAEVGHITNPRAFLPNSFLWLIIYTYHKQFFVNSLADTFRAVSHLQCLLDRSF
jgi:hypothetical protein